MQISVSSTLTVYHDGQFWVGLAEHVEGGRYGAARIVFGAEAARALKRPAVSTKAQQALAAQREAMKRESAQARSRRRAEEADARYEQRKLKRKQKHRGH